MSIEKTIQSIVASLNEGWAARVLRVFIVLALLTGLFGFYAWSEFRGLRNAEAMELAQVGRALAQGKGFTTQCLRPVDIAVLPAGTPPAHWPDLRHGPVYPLLLAIGFALVHRSFAATSFAYAPEQSVILPLGILLTMAAGLLLYRLGLRLFTPRTAVVATVAYFFSDVVLADSLSGTPLPLLTSLTAAAFLAASHAADRRRDGQPMRRWLVPLVAAGVACGLAVLTRYAMVVLPVAVAAFIAVRLDRGRGAALAVLIGVAGLVVAPWLVRNTAVCDRAFGLAPHDTLNHTVFYSGQAFDRSLSASESPARAAHALKVKLLRNLRTAIDRDLRGLGNGLFLALFLVALFHPFERPDASALRWCALLGLLLLLPFIALGGPSAPGVLRAFLPLVILIGTAFFFVLIERMELFDAGWEIVLIWLLVIVASLPAVLRLAAPAADSPYPPYAPPYAATLCAMLEDDECLATDIPWATAWYGDRPSILLPRRTADLDAINKPPFRIGGLYLTTETHRFAEDLDASWTALLERRIPEGFLFAHGLDLPPGTRDQLFLTDRERWVERGEASDQSSVISHQ